MVRAPSLSHKHTAAWGSLPSCIKLEIDVWIVVTPRVPFIIVILEMLQLFSLSPNNAKPMLPRFPSVWISPCVLFWKALDVYFVVSSAKEVGQVQVHT